MGYYYIELGPNTKKLCTIVLPWGNFEYQWLPMGLCNSLDIFHKKMSELFAGFDYVQAYIDDILILTSGLWNEHLKKLGTIFKKIVDAGIKVNVKKLFFGKPKTK